MANYTTNYGLHQWEASDDFLRTDFNTDHQLIDAALSGLQADVDGKTELVTGTYSGNGTSSRTITLGFQAKALLLFTEGGLTGCAGGSYSVYGGLVLPGHPAGLSGGNEAVELTANGFTLCDNNYNYRVNQSGTTYHYIALR